MKIVWKQAISKCYGSTCGRWDHPEKKPGVEYETHENIDDEVDEDDLYKIDKMSLDEK